MKNSTIRLPGFNSRLKAARNSAELTQQNVADALGLTLRSYQKYESGMTEPCLHNLVSLAVVLGVSTDWLLGLSDEAPADGR